MIHALQSFLNTIKRNGGDARDLRVDPPATENELQKVERRLGLIIPYQLRNAMMKVSSHLEFSWFLADGFVLPQELNEIFCGELHWGIDYLESLDRGYKRWITEVYPNTNDPYDAVWHNKFPFQEVGNGDYLSIDSEGKVVYLSHDDGEGHGYVMADSFDNLLEHWVPLGCVGAEDWQWIPFTNGMKTQIDPLCKNAKTWMSLLGIR